MANISQFKVGELDHTCRALCRREERIHCFLAWAERPLEYIQQYLKSVHEMHYRHGVVIRVERAYKCPPSPALLTLLERDYNALEARGLPNPHDGAAFRYWVRLFPECKITEAAPEDWVEGYRLPG